jgi:hypothetical protein
MSITSTVLLDLPQHRDFNMERISPEETHILQGKETIGYLYSTISQHRVLWASCLDEHSEADRNKLNYQHNSRLDALKALSL